MNVQQLMEKLEDMPKDAEVLLYFENANREENLSSVNYFESCNAITLEAPINS